MPNPLRKIVAASMILGPLLSLVSAVVSPPLKSDTAAQLAQIAQHPDRWYLYALFITVGAWFFVPSTLGLMNMLAAPAARASIVGGSLALIGVLVAIGDGTTELMYWQMGAPAADRPQMVALSDRYDHATGSSLSSPSADSRCSSASSYLRLRSHARTRRRSGRPPRSRSGRS